MSFCRADSSLLSCGRIRHFSDFCWTVSGSGVQTITMASAVVLLTFATLDALSFLEAAKAEIDAANVKISKVRTRFLTIIPLLLHCESMILIIAITSNARKTCNGYFSDKTRHD